MQFFTSLFALLLILSPTSYLAQSKSAQNKVADKNASKQTKSSAQKIDASSKKPKANQTEALAAFEAVKTAVDVTERIEKLKRFIADFPQSELKTKAVEMLVVSHVELGESEFRNGDAASGIKHFQAAANDFTSSVGENVFNDIIAKLPFNLFFRAKSQDERDGAVAIAKRIEPKVKDNAARLLALANFYLTIENADEARRIANRVLSFAPDSALAQQVLGMASRINFQLEAASQGYSRALEIEPDSIAAKRSLADVWRGLGQNEDALKLYRELLAARPDDEAARNGLVLTLFNLGQKDEAEKELKIALEQNPRNFVLQTGAAYWYAANADGAQAVELARQAAETEPRYIWANIALARGLTLEKRPLEAERALVFARQYGSFPTLDYELASVHYAAGLYDEARDDLARSFTFKNGKIVTRLAGRLPAEGENFVELLSRERRASIFQPTAVSSESEARKLKELFSFSQALNEGVDENALLKSAEDFASDADEMQTHRQLYVASRLLNRKVALPRVSEIAALVTTNLDRSLDVPAATAAVLADELYEPRRLAQTRGELINVPEVARETLSRIMRGRVEEIAGWTLFQQNKFEDASIRLRRAVGILPENSAWWRSSLWKLGAAFEASGKPQAALDAYIKSYKSDVPNETRLTIIQTLYQQLNGSLDGLEQRFSQTNTTQSRSFAGSTLTKKTTVAASVAQATSNAELKNPLPSVIAQIIPNKTVAAESQIAEPKTELVANVKADKDKTFKTDAEPKAELTAQPSPNPVSAVTPAPEFAPVVQTETDSTPAARSEIATVSEVKAETKPEPLTTPTPAETQAIAPETVASQAEEAKVQPTPVDSAIKSDIEKDNQTLEATVQPEAVATPAPEMTIVERKAEEEIAAKSAEEESLKPDVARVIIVPVAKAEPTPAPGKIIDTEPIAETKQRETATPNEASEKQIVSRETPLLLPRPRVIVQNINNQSAASANLQAGQSSQTVAPCVMQLSQNQFSLLRNGGNATLVVAFGDVETANKLTFTVESPNDIAVLPQPSIETDNSRRLFQILSTSEITKNFKITFESPCGRQEVQVKVR